MTDVPAHITIERDIAASPAAVFEAWTDAGSFARWFGTEAVQIPAESLDFERAALLRDKIAKLKGQPTSAPQKKKGRRKRR